MASSKEFYVPLRQTPCLVSSSSSTIDENDDELRDGLAKARRLSLSTVLLSMLTGILLVIILIQAVFIMYLRATAERKFLSPNGLSLSRDLERRGSIATKYMSGNETEAAKAWDEIEAGHGLVAMDPQWAAAQGLPPTMELPTDSSKVVYVIEAYHEIHCLKYIREHYMALAAGKEPWWPVDHDMHCFDALRQHVMCMADDTLLYSTGHRDSGVNQTRMCRDWDALSQWATEHTACYHDYTPPKGESRWGKCDGGNDGLPVGSLLE